QPPPPPENGYRLLYLPQDLHRPPPEHGGEAPLRRRRRRSRGPPPRLQAIPGPRRQDQPQARQPQPPRRRHRRWPGRRRRGGGPRQGRRRDVPHRAEARQRQALRRRDPALHGGRVRPPARHHRPAGHQNEDDLAVERRRRHRADPEAARVHRDGAAGGAGRVPEGAGGQERRDGDQRAVLEDGHAGGQERAVPFAFLGVQRHERRGWREEDAGGRRCDRGRRGQLEGGQVHRRWRLRVRHCFSGIIKIPDDKMVYYENLAEMYVGDDVSPDFYGWVFPKCDHVAVGTGTVTHKGDIKKFQLATRNRAKDKILGGKIIRVEAHPIPEHPRPRRLSGRVALVGDAAGYVTKCSGEGIYFAAKSGRMCAEAIVEGSEQGKRMVEESDLRKYLEKWDKTYWPTYKVLDVLQKVFYRSNPAREAFVEMCADEYVQKMTFDSYLYKTVVPGNPLDDLKLAVNTIGSLVRANALRKEMQKL
ncbi:hypothetical protein EUGRSUZ_B00512, partial [Eucalyptus grandis]